MSENRQMFGLHTTAGTEEWGVVICQNGPLGITERVRVIIFFMQTQHIFSYRFVI